jgi:protein SCO1/2
MKSENVKLLLGVIGGMAAIIVFGLLAAFAPELSRGPRPAPTPGGIPVGEYRTISDFTLTDQDGKPMKLSDLQGKTVMMLFGYTYCPDVCPLGLADLKRVKKNLGPDADKVAFVFISVDPERDTPAVLKRYVGTFDPQFIGLTGDAETIKKVTYDFDAFFEKQKPQGTEASYLVAHTSFSYLIDPQGRWRMKYPFQTPTDLIANDVRQVLKESG